MSKAAKRYKDSPTLDRSEEGEMEVKKKPSSKPEASEEKNPASKTAENDAGTEGENRGGMEEMHSRHVLDRHHMVAKHEHEHAMHRGGDKHEMHERHQADMKAMHKKHEKEMGKDGESMISKVESDKKE